MVMHTRIQPLGLAASQLTFVFAVVMAAPPRVQIAVPLSQECCKGWL
jgi:hypothetical protein